MSNSPVRRNKPNTVIVNEVHRNVEQEVIEITSDKLRLILNDHIKTLTSRKEWQVPLTMLATIMIVLSTVEFKQSWGLSPDTWTAIFVISMGLSIIWLIRAFIKMRKTLSVEDILNAAKNKT